MDIIILVEATALLKVRQISFEANLRILSDPVSGVASACDDDGASKVDRAGFTVINMFY